MSQTTVVGGLTLSDFSKKYDHQGGNRKIESIGEQQSQRRSFCHWVWVMLSFRMRELRISWNVDNTRPVKRILGDFLVIQWLGFQASTAAGHRFDPWPGNY